MSKLKICRICLRTDCKIYQYDRFNLKLYYEEITAAKVNNNDGLPAYFCYECATMLRKFRKFKEKCVVGLNILKELKWKEGITYETLSKTNRLIVKSPLDVVIKTKRVRTYYVTFTKDIKSTETDSDSEFIKEKEDDEDEKEEKINDLEVKYVSEDSMTDPGEIMDPDTDPVDENPIVDNPIVENRVEEIHIQFNQNSKIDDDNVVHEEIPKILEKVLTRGNEKRKANKNKSDSKRVFVGVKKGATKKKVAKEVTERIEGRELRNSYSEHGLKKQNPAFAKKRTRFLHDYHWKKSTLTEEEALKEFRSKGDDPKYIAAQYKCTDCLKWFREEDILKRHRQLRHNETLGSLVCRFCHMRFKWDCHLRKHLRSHFHRFECLRCNLVCPLETTAYIHQEFHNGVIRKCVHCGEEFKHSSTYYTHLRTHRSEHLCTKCGASFVSPLGLLMHTKVKHSYSDTQAPDADEESLYCDKCHIRFDTTKAYEEHLIHSAMHTEGIEEDIEAETLNMDTDKDAEIKMMHGVKGRKTTDALAITKKKRKRIPKITHRKPTTCHHCGEHFPTQKDCMKHHLAAHRGRSFFPPTERQICEVCGVSLAPGSVAMHLNTHTQEKMHHCETCGRAFNTTISMKRHQVTHTGEKKYECPLCEKRFTQNGSMKLHYRTFHLKQPYPKRNRRKKEEPVESLDPREDSTEETDTIAALRARKPTAHSLHYLTLN